MKRYYETGGSGDGASRRWRRLANSQRDLNSGDDVVQIQVDWLHAGEMSDLKDPHELLVKAVVV